MSTGGKINWLKIAYSASSLYDVIKGNTFKNLNGISRERWKKLIDNSSLQPNCNRRGFNNNIGQAKTRIGIISNQENGCNSPDSWIGFGTEGNPCGISSTLGITGSCGNVAVCSPDNGNKNTKAFGFILVK